MNEVVGGLRFAEAGHVLDAEDVGTHFFELFGLFDIVVEVVFGAGGVEDIAGVADGGFADGFAVFADGFHGDLHVGEVVEGVEDAEDVHAGVGGVVDESGDDVVGIIGVSDGIRSTE